MTNEEILKIAIRQSAEDAGCTEEDLRSGKNVVVPFKLGAHARKYLKEPITCNFISYGSNVVAAATDDVRDIASEYIDRFEYYHLFESPNMNWLTERLAPLGYKVCFMAEYFLPDMNKLHELPCDLELRVLEQKDFADLYVPQWSNALSMQRKELDVLGVGAYDGGTLVGLAACSADGDDMWQIGVDVLPSHRRKGIASALTSRLALEIIARGKVPFYCCAWSNIRSARNAIASGFVPSWVEMTIKPASVVDSFNRKEGEEN